MPISPRQRNAERLNHVLFRSPVSHKKILNHLACRRINSCTTTCLVPSGQKLAFIRPVLQKTLAKWSLGKASAFRKNCEKDFACRVVMPGNVHQCQMEEEYLVETRSVSNIILRTRCLGNFSENTSLEDDFNRVDQKHELIPSALNISETVDTRMESQNGVKDDSLYKGGDVENNSNTISNQLPDSDLMLQNVSHVKRHNVCHSGDSSKFCAPDFSTVTTECPKSEQHCVKNNASSSPMSTMHQQAQKAVGQPQTFCDAFSQFLLCSKRKRNVTGSKSNKGSSCKDEISLEALDCSPGSIPQKKITIRNKIRGICGGSDENEKVLTDFASVESSISDGEVRSLSTTLNGSNIPQILKSDQVIEIDPPFVVQNSSAGSLPFKLTSDEKIFSTEGSMVKDTANTSYIVEDDRQSYSSSDPLSVSLNLSAAYVSTSVDALTRSKADKDEAHLESQDSGISDIELASSQHTMTDSSQGSLAASNVEDIARESPLQCQSLCDTDIIHTSLIGSELSNQSPCSNKKAESMVAASEKMINYCAETVADDFCNSTIDRLRLLESCCRPVRIVLRRLTAEAIDAFNKTNTTPPAPTTDYPPLLKTPKKKDPTETLKPRKSKLLKPEVIKKRKQKSFTSSKDDLAERITLDLLTWLPELASGGSCNRRGSSTCKRKFDSLLSDDSLDDSTPYVPNFMTHSDFDLPGSMLLEKWKKVCELEKEWMEDHDNYNGSQLLKSPKLGVDINQQRGYHGGSFSCGGVTEATMRADTLRSCAVTAPNVTQTVSSDKSPKTSVLSEEHKKKSKSKKNNGTGLVSAKHSQARIPQKFQLPTKSETSASSDASSSARKLPNFDFISTSGKMKCEATSLKQLFAAGNTPAAVGNTPAAVGNTPAAVGPNSGTSGNAVASNDECKDNGPKCSQSHNACPTSSVATASESLLKSTVGKFVVSSPESKLHILTSTSLPHTCLLNMKSDSIVPPTKVKVMPVYLAGCNSQRSKDSVSYSDSVYSSVKVSLAISGPQSVHASLRSTAGISSAGSVQVAAGNIPPSLVKIIASVPVVQSSCASVSTSAATFSSVGGNVIHVTSCVASITNNPPSTVSVSPMVTTTQSSASGDFPSTESSLFADIRECSGVLTVASSVSVSTGNVTPMVGELQQDTTNAISCCIVSSKVDPTKCRVADFSCIPSPVKTTCAHKENPLATVIEDQCIDKFSNQTISVNTDISSEVCCGPAKTKASKPKCKNPDRTSCLSLKSKTGKRKPETVLKRGVTGSASLPAGQTSSHVVTMGKLTEATQQSSNSLRFSAGFVETMERPDAECNQEMSSWLAASMGLYTCLCGAAFSDGWSCHQHQSKCSSSPTY